MLFKKYKMALQNKLKAFVRFDGSGRVIPSSLILQKSKPKVGNWKEINATECCNGTPSTTTTTSTFSTTTTTTTAYYYNADYNIGLACGAVGQFNLPLTIAPDVCTSGNIVLNSGTYADYGIPNNSTIYINLNNGNVIQVQTFGSSTMSFGCTSCSGTTTTTTTTESLLQVRWQNSNVGDSCSSTNYIYFTGNPDFCAATDFYGDFSSVINSGISPGSLIAISDPISGKIRTVQLINSTYITTGSFSDCNDCQ